ncbi:hypothetical protein [Hymenobacter guriensis]|uniref:HPP family protein n=1 Tax=Hymenobacter guriensis TaxID=2793065 RepID=A0ABS0L6K5_9BACT|nr:hypothetical protein [Hymenobacter guriensis]MBG8555555.1 hypothetical protein [Hymenobacter guriensis]
MRKFSFVLSFLTATFYFILASLVEYSETAKEVFSTLMLFLPGLTFPLASTNLYSKFPNINPILLITHCFCSILIYHGAVWAYSAEQEYFLMPLVGGFAGSFAYSIVTILLLKAPLEKSNVMLAALASGLVFIPYLSFHNMIALGFALFSWTMINWFIIERKRTITNVVLTKYGQL